MKCFKLRKPQKLLIGCVIISAVIWANCDDVPFLQHNNSSGNGSDSASASKEKFVFWVTLNTEEELSVRYQVERVYVSGEKGEKIGDSSGPFDGRFKIELPNSYKDTEQIFTIEFTRKSSFFDSIPSVAANPNASAILKAFFFRTPADKLIKIPSAGKEIVVPSKEPVDAIRIAQLTMGFNEDSLTILKSMPAIPPLYRIVLNEPLISKYTSEGYRAYVGIVTKRPPDDGLFLNGTAFQGGDPLPMDYPGFFSGDDWYLALKDLTLKMGDPIRVWVIYTSTKSKPTRFYYEDIDLPAVFETITLQPSFAALGIDETTLSALLDSSAPNDDSYVLVNSIVYSGGAWECKSIFSSFKGEFRGAGYTFHVNLNGLHTSGNYGLFSTIQGAAPPTPNDEPQYAIVTGLTINIKNFVSNWTKINNLGGVAGFAGPYSKITNVQVLDPNKQFKKEAGKNVGGLVGKIDSAAVDLNTCTWPTSTSNPIPAIGYDATP